MWDLIVSVPDHCLSFYFGVHDDLLTMVKKRQLISGSPGIAKTVLQRAIKGARRRGRQKKGWENNIKEYTGIAFP